MTNTFIARKWLCDKNNFMITAPLQGMVPYYATLACMRGSIDHTHLYWLCSELWYQWVDRKHTLWYAQSVLRWRRLQSKASLYAQTSWQRGGSSSPQRPPLWLRHWPGDPRTCTRGKVIGRVVIVVHIKIARSRLLGILVSGQYGYHMHVENGEKMMSFCFKALDKDHECYKLCFRSAMTINHTYSS